MKKIATATTILILVLFYTNNVYADLVFPAIANQFMVAFVVGFYWSILIAVTILIVEACFIKKLLSVKLFQAFWYSFLVNLGSCIVGIIIVTIPFSGGRNIFSYGNMRLGTYLGLIPGYILTVLIEGLLLIACAKTQKLNLKKVDCFRTSAVMNFFSYLILLVCIMIADSLTKGQNFHIG